MGGGNADVWREERFEITCRNYSPSESYSQIAVNEQNRVSFSGINFWGELGFFITVFFICFHWNFFISIIQFTVMLKYKPAEPLLLLGEIERKSV